MSCQFLQALDLFDEAAAHVRRQIEVKGRDGLSAMHLVLCRLHRDTGHDAGRLDTFGRARLTVSGTESVGEDTFQRVLDAGQTLRGVVILVVDVQVIVAHSLLGLVAQQVIVHERFGRLAGKLHHHACRRVGIHVGILARHIVALDVDDFQEHVACLRLTGYAPLVTVGNVFLCHILAATLHQFHLHHVLNGLHGHLRLSTESHVVGYLTDEVHIFPLVRMQHGFTDGGGNFLFIEADNASVALHYGLNHTSLVLSMILKNAFRTVPLVPRAETAFVEWQVF